MLFAIKPVYHSSFIKGFSRPLLQGHFSTMITYDFTEILSLENIQAVEYMVICGIIYGISFRDPTVLSLDWLKNSIILGRFSYLLCHFYSNIKLPSSVAVHLTTVYRTGRKKWITPSWVGRKKKKKSIRSIRAVLDSNFLNMF